MATSQFDSELLQAVDRGDGNSIKDLLSKGASPNIILPNGRPLLNEMIFSATDDIIELIISSGANILLKDKSGMAALDCALSSQNIALLTRLIEKGADVNNIYTNGLGTLAIAISLGNCEIVELLLKKGANSNAVYSQPIDPQMKEFLKTMLKENKFKHPEKGMTLQMDEESAKSIVSGKVTSIKHTPLSLAKNNPTMVILLKKYGAK